MELNRKTQRLSKVILIKGIVFCLLGIVHLVASFYEYNDIKGYMPKDLGYSYILWFNGVGLFILFIGLAEILSYKGIKQKTTLAWQVSLLSSFFAAVMGLSGLITFHWVLSPPYLLLVAGVFGLVLLLKNRRGFESWKSLYD